MKGIEGYKNLEFDIHSPKDSKHGDFACNIAFKLVNALKEKPRSIADELIPLIENDKDMNSILEKVEVAGGGFINFYLKGDALASILQDVHKADKNYGKSNFGSEKKVLLEYVSANPTGPLTIAHGRQAAVGNALARILKFSGHTVYSEYYLNDAGRQIELLGKSVWARYQESMGMNVKMPEDGYQGDYIKVIAQRIIVIKKDSLLKEKEESGIKYCAKFARDDIMKSIKEDLSEMRISFDNFFSETKLYEKKAVEHALDVLRKNDHLYEKDGALWFRSTKFGDDKDRVVKKSTGEYTYLAPDIAYHLSKFERGNNLLINFWGPDHHGYVVRLKAACRALGHESRQIHITLIQLTTLYRQGKPVRMSTRAGEFVTLRELFEEVGVDATRFFFCMRRQESQLDFDLDLAKEKSQENPVYYLQYAHARIASLLRFSEKKVTTKVDFSKLSEKEEKDLIRMVVQFPDALIQASDSLEPFRLVDYLRQIAASFHKFYTFHRVVTDDEELTQARLLLADATRIVLRNGLDLLGISQPDSM